MNNDSKLSESQSLGIVTDDSNVSLSIQLVSAGGYNQTKPVNEARNATE